MALIVATSHRFGRALIALPAVVAIVFATAVPMVHALAHERAHGHVHGHSHDHPPHPHATPPGPERQHDHEEIHPTALHDDWLLTLRVAVDLGFALPAVACHEPVAAEGEMVRRPATSVILPRAPPPSVLARAPPLV